jgi:peptidoglycan LD-endopeptidase CwlK
MITRKQIILVATVMVSTVILASIFFNPPKDKELQWFDPKAKWFNDEQTLKIVMNLHPKFRPKIAEFLTRMERELGLTAFGTSGYRSWEKQAQLYAQNPSNGRPGYSMHNYGFAVDLNVKDASGKIILRKADSSQAWKKTGIVKLAQEIGLKWGGDGAFGSYHDPIHFFEEPNGLNSTKLRAMYEQGKKDKAGYVLV